MRNDGLNAEQMISKAKVSIMNGDEWKWMAGIVMMGSSSIVDQDHECKTAATDGLNEVYSREFVEGLSMPQVMFIVLHENFHKMFRHLFVWQNLWKENPMLANVACDAVINTQYLNGKAGIDFVEGGILMPEYADVDKWNVKAVYDDLMSKAKQSPQSQPKQGHDEHDWAEAQAVSAQDAKVIEKTVDNALRQAALAGNIGANMPRTIKEMLVPEVDWRSYVAEFVKSVCSGADKQTWRRPHRTYVAYDLYVPAPYSESIGRILIAGDTSGSIGDNALSCFLGHMQQLCNEVQPSGVDIAWWGSSVVGVDSFERGDLGVLANAVKPIGGGGTTPSCITDWIDTEKKRDDYVCAVVITDGEFYDTNVGNWDGIPVLWLVINNRVTPPIPVGTTINLKEMV
jgi:predicted metal-dependent peptidase